MYYKLIVRSKRQRILKRKKQLILYKGALIKFLADFSAERLCFRRKCDIIFQVLKDLKYTYGEYYIQQNHLSIMQDKDFPK
jgi:hypothetical protein